MNPQEYFIAHGLYDPKILEQHCQENLVKIITSCRFPNLVMLHYSEKAQFENTWTEFNRMCRGLIVDMERKTIVAHPFDKFFNMGQVPETNYKVLAGLGKFETTEKLDGSMIILFKEPQGGVLVATTKGSFDSEHGEYATDIIRQKVSHSLLKYTQKGILIFELISKKFQIVIDYKKKGYEEGLYLIGYREHETGLLVSSAKLAEISAEIGFPMYKTYQFDSLDDLVAHTSKLSVLEEGFVLRFANCKSDDLLVKVKGPEYLRVHRFISHLSEKHILEAMQTGEIELLMELAPEEYRDDVAQSVSRFFGKIRDIRNLLDSKFLEAPKTIRKEFAIWIQQNCPAYLKGLMFNRFDNKEITDAVVLDVIAKLEPPSSQTKI